MHAFLNVPYILIFDNRKDNPFSTLYASNSKCFSFSLKIFLFLSFFFPLSLTAFSFHPYVKCRGYEKDTAT